MTPREPRSQLAKLQPTKVDPEKVKARGWREDGILVISAKDTRLSWPEREFITQIANKLYGKPQNKENAHD